MLCLFFSVTTILFHIYQIHIVQFNMSHIHNTFITCTVAAENVVQCCCDYLNKFGIK
jgi:major membrane immunogen (membrane-anchored lipoprotein)